MLLSKLAVILSANIEPSFVDGPSIKN